MCCVSTHTNYIVHLVERQTFSGNTKLVLFAKLIDNPSFCVSVLIVFVFVLKFIIFAYFCQPVLWEVHSPLFKLSLE